MRIGKGFVRTALSAALVSSVLDAAAHPAQDDLLGVPLDNSRSTVPGPHLRLMPFVGPGFRATYEHRFTIEKDMSELVTQVVGTVALPFAEVGLSADVRFFLMTFGASVGYHDEWQLLQFNPDPATGRDTVGRVLQDPAEVPPLEAAQRSYNDLTLDARAKKDANSDVREKRWAFYEGRWGFVWPAYNFVGSSTLALRHDGRPDVTYDWENATVLNGGWNLRWEGYAIFHSRNVGFFGPASRILWVPRNRTEAANGVYSPTPSGFGLPNGSACQSGVVSGLDCVVKREFEVQYGFIGGLRPNWVNTSDTLLIRFFTTAGLKDNLFGTQAFRLPIQLLVAYMVTVDL